jgi:hypothetical protein
MSTATATEVSMPKLSDSMEEGTILSWLLREVTPPELAGPDDQHGREEEHRVGDDTAQGLPAERSAGQCGRVGFQRDGEAEGDIGELAGHERLLSMELRSRTLRRRWPSRPATGRLIGVDDGRGTR